MSDSILCTGSHLNRRTFVEDEYWPSFQSTIVSGQVMSVDNNQTNEETSTMESCLEDTTMTTTNGTSVEESTNTNGNSSISIRDESSIADDKAEENPLNLNLDAISNPDLDEYFFDCPAFDKSPANLMRPTAPSPNRRLRILYSPQPQSQPIFYQVQFASPPEEYSGNNNIDCSASPCKRRPASATRISPELHATSIASDQSPAAGVKTGSYLAEMIKDFNDLHDHSTSTPTISTDSGNPSSDGFSTGASYSRKNLDSEFQNAETIIITSSKQQQQQHEISGLSDKENFFAGKYSRSVNDRRKLQQQQKPTVVTRSGKVAMLSKYFQSQLDDSMRESKSINRSKIPVPIRKSRVKKSPQAITRLSGSPGYKVRRSYKLVSSRSGMRIPSHHPFSATTFSSSGSDSFLTRNQPKYLRSMRVQSCSDAVDDNEIESMEVGSKSHSTGDLTSDSSAPIKAHDSLKIYRGTYLKADQSMKQEQTSSPKIKSPKKYSAINTRRSVNSMVKNNVSPAKPVREIRKMFTPRASKAANGNISQKKDAKLVVPKILISHHS